MLLFVLSLLISFGLQLMVIRYFKVHVQAKKTSGLDLIHSGPQKIHILPTPRIGGLGLYLSTCLTIGFVALFLDRPFLSLHGLFLIAVTPVFLGGLIEDLTCKVRPLIRLLLAVVSALLAIFLLGAEIKVTQIPGLDWLLQSKGISLMFTIFLLSGLTNAFNIIDGFNGLVGVVGVLISLALFYVGFKVQDYFIMMSTLILIGSLCGFLIWNYPFGHIFIGDGGAYLVGFWIGVLSIMLPARNPQVSPWFGILINLYPATETLFSIYRRSIVKKVASTQPDNLHFHTLIFKRLVKWVTLETPPKLARNALTAPYLWAMTLLTILPALIFWDTTFPLVTTSILFVGFYVYLYMRLIRFNAPKFLVLKNHPKVPIKTQV
jgi:UDP-N-acetylmuramyl pentapeptide phosphotransferase/UDP-N-acetylglucosamine-1-phosphate transferase